MFNEYIENFQATFASRLLPNLLAIKLHKAPVRQLIGRSFMQYIFRQMRFSGTQVIYYSVKTYSTHIWYIIFRHQNISIW